ncbi:MAG: fluoride efflux transporter CrcB [Phycisphaerales bacterium]|nr:fluoride efflux transporter CrcB [Phycisphaerales bacterium]
MNEDAPDRLATQLGPDAAPTPVDPTDLLSLSLVDLAAVAAGGALGALLRFLISHWAQSHWPKHAHLATLTVNALGSLILGAIAGWTLSRPMPDWAHRGIAIGALGAFTTYSTFALEAVKLHTSGRSAAALAYVLVTTVTCVVLAALGYWLASKLAGGSA